MIFKINSENSDSVYLSKSFRIIDSKTNREIEDERILIKIKEILRGIKETFKYIENHTTTDMIEDLSQEMDYDYREIDDMKDIFEIILYKLGYSVYFKEIDKTEEVADL